MPPGARGFARRHAWGRQVAYGSQFLAPWDRALDAAQDIRWRLGGREWVSLEEPPPPKPKWMRWSTYDALMARRERDEEIVERHFADFVQRLREHR